MTAATELAQHFSLLEDDALPERARQEMRRLLVDYFGVALAGSQTDTGKIVADFVAGLGGVPQATVVGRGHRVPAVHAAFANAVSEHSIELDDVDDEALFHYGPPIVSAALAVGQWQRSSGRALVTAILAGCEVTNRLSLACNPSLRDRGFHTTPTCGVFGAAVAAGRLLSLTPDQMTSALGLAGAQASGLMEMYGTSMQKRLNPGPAARNGVTAASLAALGYTGADTILDGPRGFGAAFTDRFDPDRLVATLTGRITTVVEYKAYSSARPIHNAIDCALEIRGRGGPAPETVERIVVYRHPAWADYHSTAHPRTYHEAQVSLPYSVAVALVTGRALPDEYRPPLLGDPQVMQLAAKVEVEKDDSLPRGVSCRMVVTSAGGTRSEAQVDHPLGSVGNPLSDAQLVDKHLALSSPVLGESAARALVDAVRDVETIDDVNDLVALAVGEDGA